MLIVKALQKKPIYQIVIWSCLRVICSVFPYVLFNEVFSNTKRNHLGYSTHLILWDRYKIGCSNFLSSKQVYIISICFLCFVRSISFLRACLCYFLKNDIVASIHVLITQKTNNKLIIWRDRILDFVAMLIDMEREECRVWRLEMATVWWEEQMNAEACAPKERTAHSQKKWG